MKLEDITASWESAIKASYLLSAPVSQEACLYNLPIIADYLDIAT
jgi:hypothetical protein